MEQNQFDKKIRESLQQFEVPFNDAPWKGIEQSLDAMDLPTTDGKDDFDAFISGKLENITGPVIQPNWERMSAALDKAGMSNQAFDIEIKSKINFINPVYQPSHWELLATKLRREKAIKESLYKNKIAEATLFLLLLLNFYHYSPNPPILVTPTVTTEVVAKTATQEQQILATTEAAQNNKSEETELSKATSKTVTKEELTESSIQKATTPTPTASSPDNTIYGLSNLPTIAIEGVSLQPTLQPINFGIDGNNVGLNKDLFVEILPSLAPVNLTTGIVPLDCKNCKRPKSRALFRIGIVGHTGLAIATHSTNQDLDFLAQDKRHVGIDYGSGAVFGFKWNRYELEFGLNYAQKSYNHLALHNFAPQQLKGMSVQTLQIPVNARYNYAVLSDGKLHLYGQMGGSFNLVLREEQDIIRLNLADADWLDELALVNAQNAIGRNAYAKSTEGILGGEHWKDNQFVTINFGAGAEYYISPKWSVFLQPDFQYNISQNRIGPTKDVINTFKISFGVKSSFH